jgi:ATP-dependent exoDNAse (exonuclease V) alpha subunit
MIKLGIDMKNYDLFLKEFNALKNKSDRNYKHIYSNIEFEILSKLKKEKDYLDDQYNKIKENNKKF